MYILGYVSNLERLLRGLISTRDGVEYLLGMIDDASQGSARSRRFRLPVLKVPSPNYRKHVDKPGSCSTISISEDCTTVLKAPLAFHLDGCDDTVTIEYQAFENKSTDLLEWGKEIYRHLGEYKRILPCL